MSAGLMMSLQPRAGHLVPANGLNLFISEEGSGPSVVFIHGLGWTHALWREQLSNCASHYRCIAGDSRGHGQSSRRVAPYTIREMADDWLAALDTLGIRDWCLVGFSQGARIAQILASLAPGRTRALLLIGSGCHDDAGLERVMEARLAAARDSPEDGAVAAAASIFSAGFTEREPEFVRGFVRQRVMHDLDALAAATRALYGFDSRQELGKITCPASIVVGDQDRLCPVEAAKELAQALHAPLNVVSDSGHMVTLEQPQAFNKLLADFLRLNYPAH